MLLDIEGSIIFDSPACVNSFRILHRDGTAYNTAYKLQGSNDGTNYTDLGSYTNNSANADLKHSVYNNNSYLYYRLYMTANAGSGNGAKTIQFYGTK